jgi:uncharacterized membrane protein
VDVVFKSIYARACMGAGLSALSGVRAFLPVAFLALYSRLEFASAPVLTGTPFAFLEKTWVIALLFALAVIELATDKMPALASAHRQVMRPIKIALGGLVFAAAMAPDEWIAMTVCGILGLAIAGLAEHAAHSMRPESQIETAPFVLLSIYADVGVLVGTLLFVLVPVIGALFACFMFLFVYRLQQRRKRKHKGLRILKG